MPTKQYKIFKGYPKSRRKCAVEFSFEPGRKYYTDTYDLIEAASWAEAYIRGEIGMAGKMITFGEFAAGFYEKTGRGKDIKAYGHQHKECPVSLQTQGRTRLRNREEA